MQRYFYFAHYDQDKRPVGKNWQETLTESSTIELKSGVANSEAEIEARPDFSRWPSPKVEAKPIHFTGLRPRTGFDDPEL
jgi:hypothetical protein